MLIILAKRRDFQQNLGRKGTQGRLECGEYNQLEERQLKRNIKLGFFLHIPGVENTPLIVHFSQLPHPGIEGNTHLFKPPLDSPSTCWLIYLLTQKSIVLLLQMLQSQSSCQELLVVGHL